MVDSNVAPGARHSFDTQQLPACLEINMHASLLVQLQLQQVTSNSEPLLPQVFSRMLPALQVPLTYKHIHTTLNIHIHACVAWPYHHSRVSHDGAATCQALHHKVECVQGGDLVGLLSQLRTVQEDGLPASKKESR